MFHEKQPKLTPKRFTIKPKELPASPLEALASLKKASSFLLRMATLVARQPFLATKFSDLPVTSIVSNNASTKRFKTTTTRST